MSSTSSSPGPRRRLLVVSGPSGAGKGTLISRLLAARPTLARVVCVTTRPPRSGEGDGEQFHFITADEFARLRRQGKLACHNATHGTALYGVERARLEALGPETTGVLELDYANLEQVRQDFAVTSVLVIAPSADTLRERLFARGESAEVERRLRGGVPFLDAVERYDHVVVNDDPADAASRLVSIADGTYGDEDVTARALAARQAREILALLRPESG